MAHTYTFFDPHTKQFLVDSDRNLIEESLQHTILEYLYPDAKFSVAVLDDRVTAKELQENHPLGHKLMLSSGNRFVFTDSETAAGINTLFPEVAEEMVRGIKDRGAYGALAVSQCSGKHEQLRVKVIAEDGDPSELEYAKWIWNQFKDTGKLVADVDPANYLSVPGYDSTSIPQLLIPASELPDWKTGIIYKATPHDLAIKFDIPARKIELTPHVFERELRILIIDDETGATSSTYNSETGKYEQGFEHLDKETALALTGDCHGKMSLELAQQKFGTDPRSAIQFRGLIKGLGSNLEQKSSEYAGYASDKICKGSLVAHDLAAMEWKDGPPDIILARSSFKGAEKPPLGMITHKMYLAELDRSQQSQQSSASVIGLFPDFIEDLLPILEPKIANLAAVQNDPLAVAKLYCENFERRQKLFNKGEAPEPEEDRDPDDPVPVMSALPTEKYDAIKAALDSGNVSLLYSGIIAPELKKFLKSQFKDLALGRDEDAKFDRGFAIPSKELKDGEICVPWLADGAEIIVYRAPLINTNGVHILINKHVGDFDYSSPETRPNYIQCNDSTKSALVPGQQSVMKDFALDFDGDCLGVQLASKFPHLRDNIKTAQQQQNRFPDTIKCPKLEFDGISQEQAALQMQNGCVGVISNGLTRIQSQLSAITRVSDLDGVATLSDRLELAGTISKTLRKFSDNAERNEESLILRPKDLDPTATEWFDKLEKSTRSRIQAVIQAPRLGLMTHVPDDNRAKYELAKTISGSLYGFKQNLKESPRWFSTPHPDSLTAAERASFDRLRGDSAAIVSQIDEILKIRVKAPAGGSFDVENSQKVLDLYQQLQQSGSVFILSTERELLRDLVGIASYQNQIAVDMPKSARAADADVVQRLNRFLPSKMLFMQQKKNDRYYSDLTFAVDGFTPQDSLIARVNQYFTASEIKIEPPICFRSLYKDDYSSEIYAKMLGQKRAFDADWGMAVRMSLKAKNEEGCVLKITDNKGRELEITNLNKFGHDFNYDSTNLAGMRLRIELNDHENYDCQGIDSYHKYMVVAESKTGDFQVLGTLCEFSKAEQAITYQDVGSLVRIKDVHLAAPPPDKSSEYFQKARDAAVTFRAHLINTGEDVSKYAAALWHEVTEGEGKLVDDLEYQDLDNRISSSISYFFPDQFKQQILTTELNLHQISLDKGIDPASLALGESSKFKISRDPLLDETGKLTGYQRTVNLEIDGEYQQIGKLWERSLPADLSGREQTGSIAKSRLQTMTLEIPGYDPIGFGNCKYHALANESWIDREVDISFKPVETHTCNLRFGGRVLGKLERRAVDLLAETDRLGAGKLPIAICMKGSGDDSHFRISVPSEDSYPFNFNLVRDKNVDYSSCGLQQNITVNGDATIDSQSGGTVGVFLRENGEERQIGETTISAASKATIVTLAKNGNLTWQGLTVGDDGLVSGKENRRFLPEITNGDFDNVMMRSAGTDFAIKLDLNLAAEKLPVIQRPFENNYHGRVAAKLVSKLNFTSTFGALPVGAQQQITKISAADIAAKIAAQKAESIDPSSIEVETVIFTPPKYTTREMMAMVAAKRAEIEKQNQADVQPTATKKTMENTL